MNERISPLNPKLGRKPRLPQDPQLSPAWRGKITFCREMLGQGSEQGVPAFVADGWGLAEEQGGLGVW